MNTLGLCHKPSLTWEAQMGLTGLGLPHRPWSKAVPVPRALPKGGGVLCPGTGAGFLGVGGALPVALAQSMLPPCRTALGMSRPRAGSCSIQREGQRQTGAGQVATQAAACAACWLGSCQWWPPVRPCPVG